MRLPQLHVLPANAFGIYDLAAIPLQIIGETNNWLGDAISFPPGDIVRVRPFMFFIFWFLVGLTLLWSGVRRRILLKPAMPPQEPLSEP